MKSNRSTGYALLAVAYMARQKDRKQLIASAVISKQYGISPEYLLKLLQDLVQAKILKSKRGPHGGYSLAKAPEKISVLQIVEAVEDSTESRFKVAGRTKGEKFGSKIDAAYAKALKQGRAVLSKTKISDLIAK